MARRSMSNWFIFFNVSQVFRISNTQKGRSVSMIYFDKPAMIMILVERLQCHLHTIKLIDIGREETEACNPKDNAVVDIARYIQYIQV